MYVNFEYYNYRMLKLSHNDYTQNIFQSLAEFWGQGKVSIILSQILVLLLRLTLLLFLKINCYLC